MILSFFFCIDNHGWLDGFTFQIIYKGTNFVVAVSNDAKSCIFSPCRLRIAFPPMLLHLHQDQLDFLISFFGAKSLSVDQNPGCHKDSDGSKLLSAKNNNIVRPNSIIEEAFLPYFQVSCVTTYYLPFIVLNMDFMIL